MTSVTSSPELSPCTAKLLPVNFEQIRQAQIGFPGGGVELDATSATHAHILLFGEDQARYLLAASPADAEALGLWALMLFCESRRDARFVTGPDGEPWFVPLHEQDTARWHGAEIDDRLVVAGGRDLLEEAGGERYAYIPCLNDSVPGMNMLEAVVRKELSGWI